MSRRPFSRAALVSDLALLGYLAAIDLLLHLFLNAYSYYGYQRDELYFIACGNHLDFGYVDIGPLAMWLGRLSRAVLGESVFALRFFPALAGAATVFLAGLIARELGGKRFAQCLAALSAFIAPIWLGSHNVLALSAFEPVFWGLCAYFIIRIIRTGDSRLWVWVGVSAGFGLLNKPSMLFFGAALVVGLLLTPQRRFLADKWLWVGGAVAFVIASPYLYWQTTHGWATLQFMIGMNKTIMARIPAFVFLAGQILYMHPLNVPIWVAGLGYYLFAKDGKPYRALGWAFLAVFLFLLIGKSKIYYLAPAFMLLLGAGALVVERFLANRNLRWPRVAIPAAMLLGGAVTAPVCLPILPIEKVDAYISGATLGLLRNAYEVTNTFHDMMGWENQAATVAKVYHELSPEEQATCIIFASNFGRAGAIDFYGKAYGLPPATSVHQNYYFWGPPKTVGETMIVVGLRQEELQQLFGEVRVAATITCKECVSFENNVPVHVCRKPKGSLKDLWPTLRARAFLN